MTSSPDKLFRAALVQLRSGRSVDANLETVERLIARAAQGGAAYVQTPENTALMEQKPELTLQAAQTEEAVLPARGAHSLGASHPHDTVAGNAVRSNEGCRKWLSGEALHRVTPESGTVKCHEG